MNLSSCDMLAKSTIFKQPNVSLKGVHEITFKAKEEKWDIRMGLH